MAPIWATSGPYQEEMQSAYTAVMLAIYKHQGAGPSTPLNGMHSFVCLYVRIVRGKLTFEANSRTGCNGPQMLQQQLSKSAIARER